MSEKLIDYVDMTFGTGDKSLLTIGPMRPHASVAPGPDTFPRSYSTGYSPKGKIRGFSQIHANCGEPKYGNFLISPQIGLATALDSHDSEKENENPTAAEYGVTLARYGIDVCLTPTEHSVFYKFKYPTSNEASLVIDMAHFYQLHSYTHLFGNEKFKTRLIQELKRFRLFNKLGERKVFSAFVCGPSGIGKTLTAKLLHDYLAPSEPYIKINLGNYSDHNALSSLIGSPRGYVGSSKGELSGKIEASKSTVILIDEFEKASREVHNFFLEVLADGRFTDSQGREFDLNKYILIFTSNISETDFQEKVSPELRSRFDLLYRMVLLKQSEKRQYARYKIDYYTNKVNTELRVALDPEKVYSSVEQRVAQLDNIRFITREIEQAVMQQAETADGAEEQTFLNSKQ